jgi:RNA polymerase sigma-32 factor
MRIGGAIIGRHEGLDAYLGAIRKFPMLGAQEEHRLSRRWRDAGDTAALDRLVTSHLRLVAKMARGFIGYGLPVADVIAAGNLGLMRAAQRFDPARGFRLATYATWWIRAEMQEYVLDSWSLVRIGRNAAQKKLFFNLRRLKAELRAIDEGELSPHDVGRIACALEVPEADVVEMNGRLAAGDLSLNRPQAAERDDDWQDNVADERIDQETALGDDEEMSRRRALVNVALAALNERERHILFERRLRDRPATLDALSARYGVSRERIRQIEARAFAKLQAQVASPAAGSMAIAAE